jgi:hypothetical protein
LVEAPQVPQLSTKSGPENINRIDEEARVLLRRKLHSFPPQENTFVSVSDKRIIKINYYIFYYIFPIIFMLFFIYYLVFLIILIINLFIYEFIKLNKFYFYLDKVKKNIEGTTC